MVAFFCSTPFQIMNALVIKENGYRNVDVVLYILDYFNDAEKYVEKLENTNLFQEVKFLKAWKIYRKAYETRRENTTKFVSKLSHSIWRVYYYIRYEKILQKLGIDGENIEEVLISYREPICLLLARKKYKKHLDIGFVGFEDGSGSYSGELDEIRGKVEKLFHIPKQVFEKQAYWVYRPDQIESRDKYINRIYRMKIDKVENFLPLIYNIWGDMCDDLVEANFIYFDSIDNIKCLNQIIPKLIEVCGLANIVIKKHPRRMDSYYENADLKMWKLYAVPFEVVLAKQNMENKFYLLPTQF